MCSIKQYLILVICALSVGAEAQTCYKSIANLPKCLYPNTTVTSNPIVAQSFLCVVADLYNLVSELSEGKDTNVTVIVATVLLISLQLLSNLGYPVSDLSNSLAETVTSCIPENFGNGTDLQTLLDRLLGD